MRLREVIKSKIHKATITKTELEYSGSIGIDKTLLVKTDIAPGERVQVLNFNNGQRFETYVIEEEENSGIIAIYGPAARCGNVGDEICIVSYLLITVDEIAKIKEKVIILDKNNKIKSNTVIWKIAEQLEAGWKIQNPNTTKSKINPKSQIQNQLFLGFWNWDLFGSIGSIWNWDLVIGY